MNREVAVFFSVCVTLVMGSLTTGSTPPPKNITSGTDLPTAANSTAIDPDQFFAWFKAIGGNKTDNSSTPTSTPHPDSQRLNVGNPITPTLKPESPTRKLPPAWLPQTKSEHRDTTTEPPTIAPKTRITDSTHQTTTGSGGFNSDYAETPTSGNSQDKGTELKGHTTTQVSVTEAEITTTDPQIDADLEWLRSIFPNSGRDNKPEPRESTTEQTIMDPKTRITGSTIQSATDPGGFNSGNSHYKGTELKGHTTTQLSLTEAEIEAEITTTDPHINEDLEWLRSMFPESGRDNKTETQEEKQHISKQENNQSTILDIHETRQKHSKFQLPPPDKFYEWLKNLKPDSASKSRTTEHPELMSKVSPDNSVVLTTKLIVLLSVFAGILGLFVILISCYIILRRNRSKMAMNSEAAPVKPVSEVYFSECTDVFHGIPTNNDIWKNLDMLSVNTPSVLPDCNRKF